VLDMAAAPGGKTTHLVSRLNDEGLVVANDSNIQRVPSLQGNLQRWGAFSAAVTNHPGERFGNWFPETFDCVLLDAPCSGEALRTGERHKSRMISPQERSTFHQRQVRLLNSAFQALRPGGQLVYSTCSLAPEEDEAVLDALLRLYPQQASIEAVDHLLPVPAPGSVLDGQHEYNSAVRRAVRLWPHLYDTSGFFAAFIRKNDSVSGQEETPPQRSLEKAGYKLLTRQEQEGLQTTLQEIYGFDLNAVIESRGLTLWKCGHFISAIPELWLTHFAECPFVSVGMTLGKQSRREFAPSHELISRFSASFTRRRITLDEKQVSAWLAEQNLQRVSTPFSAGELVLLEDSEHEFLGRGRVEGDGIKNMLPRWL
jgi:16S rRNA (cytosine1407-C5)-methyltransferase